MRRITILLTTLSALTLICLPLAAQQGSCPVRRLPNGQVANPNWCRPHSLPQVLPTPPAVSSYANQPAPQGNNVYPVSGPMPNYYVSNACYIALAPPQGCYLQVRVLPGTSCYCMDQNGNAYSGQIQ